jgi:type VI secretion system secreted protein VgrG
MDSREAQQMLEQAVELTAVLAGNTQRQLATLPGEAQVADAAALAAKPGSGSASASASTPTKGLPVQQGQAALARSIAAVASSAGSAGGSGSESSVVGGGHGTVAAWLRPELVLSAAEGIGTSTPASVTVSAGATLSLAAAQIGQTALADFSVVAASGLVLYTDGREPKDAAIRDTGIRLHAASGSVSVQALQGAARLAADRAVRVQSTSAAVKVAAATHVLLTAAGAALKIEGGNITLTAPGKVQFKASSKQLTGPASARAQVEVRKPGQLRLCELRAAGAAAAGDSLVPTS